MKEAILSVKRDDGLDYKVKVKLTSDHLIVSDINRFPPLSSTAIDSPVSDALAQSNNGSPQYPTSDASTAERVVTIKRQPGGGLGISVKGGAEHGIPVLISRVFVGQAADQTHLLHPGDAIMAINSKRVENMLHDDVVGELRSCGAEVALTVKAYNGASQILHSHGGSTSTGE